MAESRRRWPKVIGIIVLALVAIIALATIVLNLYVRIAFSEFYALAEQKFEIPGIGVGFVPQDQDYIEAEDLWLFSGYMADGSPSPIYKRASDGSIKRVLVELEDGSAYEGHGGGITSNDEWVYLTTEAGYTAIPLTDVLSADDGESVKAAGEVALEVAPAFINIEDDVLYAGDFYYPGPYDTPEHEHLATPDGSMNYAIMAAYPADASEQFGFTRKPDRIYSIPDCVQGFCTDDAGNFILSTSVAISPSRFLIYDREKLDVIGEYDSSAAGKVPLVSLYDGNLMQTITAPPMSEGVDWVDGMFYSCDEAASNKYFYGKLYGASHLYAIDPARFPTGELTDAR